MCRFFRLLLVLCLSVPAFAAPAVADLVQKYSKLTLGEAKAASTAFPVTVGHMKFVLDSGTVTPVMAGDQQVGLFLNGSGTFTYESANKDELPTLKYNAKHADVSLQGSSITEKFKSVLLRGNGLPAPAGDAAAAPAAPFKEAREMVERSRFGFDRAEYVFVLQALNAPASRLVRADINGTERSYLYLYDDAWTRNESLTMLRRPRERGNKDSEWLYPTQLSRQSIGRDNRVAAPVNARLTHLDVTLVNTDGPNATLNVTETIVPQRPLSAISFELYEEYWFDLRKEPRRYNVRSVTDGQGNKLSYDHDMGTLVVGFAQPAPAGKPLELKIEIDGDILYRPDGSNYWELGIEPWFPMLAQNEMLFTYHALLKVKKPFAVFSSGKTVRRETEGDWNVLEAKLDQPVGAIAILAGKYQYDEETKNGLTVRVASFMGKNASAWKALRSIAFSASQIYPRFLGPFPFDEITIIERNSLGWGQAPAGIVFITKEAFQPLDEENNDYVQGVNLRVAHELAHMYWGHSVKAASSEEVWIHEAFSEYSAALFMKEAGRPNDYTKAFNAWKSGAKDATNITNIPWSNRLQSGAADDGDFIARTNLVYNKGAYLLAALHREMGDEQFLTFLKSYQRSFKGKFGTTADVMGLLQFMTKKDYAPFFEQYYYGTAMPEVKAK
ncbi:MAG TPA: M1 family aminopeptidase [Thermoanaerobaculia bacterium]|jgi:hypothetical protein|nr:M1 family aminopeptidase [Thermoanaerobaculia bacterium]